MSRHIVGVGVMLLWSSLSAYSEVLTAPVVTGDEDRPAIVFVNESKSELQIAWLVSDDEAKMKNMGRIAPGSSLNLQTTIGHQFRVRLAEKNLNLYFTASDPNLRIVVDDSASKFSLHGWSIVLNHELWAAIPDKTRTMLRLMSKQLKRIVAVLSAKQLARIRKVKIWINPEYEGVQPTAEYHPDKGWLKRNGRNEAMVKCVEVTNVKRFKFENTRMPYVMLHELAHAYHDQVLGFNNVKIREAFEQATDSEVYDQVRRFTGERYIEDKAYAMTNHKEYFAESTEAFFGKNDFYPFDRKELKAADPEMDKLLSEIWGEPTK